MTKANIRLGTKTGSWGMSKLGVSSSHPRVVVDVGSEMGSEGVGEPRVF